MTTNDERQAMLTWVRRVIAAHLAGIQAPEAPVLEAFDRSGGAFVTLHLDGDLRGCIGHIESGAPLRVTLAACAVAAATSDPRFPRLTSEELDRSVIEVSLLGPLEPVQRLEEIEVGRHGLVVQMGYQRGLLLPQVAPEWGWNREQFVEQTCRKAGLPRDAWAHGARLSRFAAEVFGEVERRA